MEWERRFGSSSDRVFSFLAIIDKICDTLKINTKTKLSLCHKTKEVLLMVAMVVGIILIAFTVFAALPAGLGWSAEILSFLKGCAPVLSAFIGLIAVFIGIADLKDKREALKEEKTVKLQDSQN